MTSLLDSAALSGISVQLLVARRRLWLRTGGELLTVGQIAMGFREYIKDCDEERASAPASTNDAPGAHLQTRAEKLE